MAVSTLVDFWRSKAEGYQTYVITEEQIKSALTAEYAGEVVLPAMGGRQSAPLREIIGAVPDVFSRCAVLTTACNGAHLPIFYGLLSGASEQTLALLPLLTMELSITGADDIDVITGLLSARISEELGTGDIAADLAGEAAARIIDQAVTAVLDLFDSAKQTAN